jgi:hypothetical protein
LTGTDNFPQRTSLRGAVPTINGVLHDGYPAPGDDHYFVRNINTTHFVLDRFRLHTVRGTALIRHKYCIRNYRAQVLGRVSKSIWHYTLMRRGIIRYCPVCYDGKST